MDTTSRFWDKTAPKYARMPIADEAVYQKKLEITRSYMKPDFEVIEFGCGTGGTAIAHAPHAKRIRAVDFSAQMLELARQRARDAGVSNVEFEQADIDSYRIAPQSMDMVLALSLLHLLEDPRDSIGRIHTMLKPGGYFVSSTACLADFMGFIKYVAPLGKAVGLLPQLTVFSNKELQAMISEEGFSIVHHWLPGEKQAAFIVARKGQ